MKKRVIVLLVILVVGLGFGIFFLELGRGEKTVFENLTQSPDSQTSTQNTNSQTQSGSAVSVPLTVKNFEFSPPTIIVKKGQTVTLEAKSVDIVHSFEIADLGVVGNVEPFVVKKITFKADRVGRFPITCTKNCGPEGYDGMKGVVVVK